MTFFGNQAKMKTEIANAKDTTHNNLAQRGIVLKKYLIIIS